MSFFKGYIRTKGKRPLQPFKDCELLTLDEVQNYPEYAGVLAADTVLIDVDNKEQANTLLDIVDALEIRCQVRETTRGMHFYFKNDGTFAGCGTALKLAIGLDADIKVGIKPSISVLKFHGEVRPIVYDILEGETYQTAPKWLHPISTTIDLFNLGEGDGRNDRLFRYILPLSGAGFSMEETRECIGLINKYVLSDSLSDAELSTLLRDEAFKTELAPSFFGEKGKFLFNIFGDYLINQLNIRRINGQLHIYRNGAYEDGLKKIEHAMLQIIPDLTQARRNEVLAYIDVVKQENEPPADAHLIAFKNGVLNIETNELLAFSPDYVITNRIDHDYNPEAYSDLLDHTLDRLACGDANVRALLEEMAGYCFYRRNELRKAFILVGDKANGKSTYIAMLQTMIGEQNSASLDLKELAERFKTAELFRKLVNLGDDIDDDFIGNTAIFKKLVSGDRLSAERKGQDPFEFNNYSKFVFSANVLPRVKDNTGAVLDRLIVIPFNAHFSKDDADYRPYIKYELCQEAPIEYLIRLGVEGLQRVLARRAFTASDKVQANLDEYNELNNPILLFFKDLKTDDLCRESVEYWHSKYHEFCVANGITTLSRIEFSRRALRLCPTLEIKRKTVNGKTFKMFVTKDL